MNIPDSAAHFAAESAAVFPGSVSVVVQRVSPTSETLFEHNADAVLRTASSAKLALLFAVASAIEGGELDPSELLHRDSAPFVRDSGLWWHLEQSTLSVADAAKLVGTLSDNLATNVLLARLGGPAAVARTAESAGLGGFTLHDFVRDERLPEHPSTLSTGSARAYGEAFAMLWRRRCGGDPLAQRVLDWMRDSADLSMVASAFGLDPLAHSEPDRGLVVINKTGTSDGVRADSGIVARGTDVIAYSCLINWEVADPETDPIRERALECMRIVGQFVRADEPSGQLLRVLGPKTPETPENREKSSKS